MDAGHGEGEHATLRGVDREFDRVVPYVFTGRLQKVRISAGDAEGHRILDVGVDELMEIA